MKKAFQIWWETLIFTGKKLSMINLKRSISRHFIFNLSKANLKENLKVAGENGPIMYGGSSIILRTDFS